MNIRWIIFLGLLGCAAMVVLNYCLGYPAEYKWLFMYAALSLLITGCDALDTVKSVHNWAAKVEKKVGDKFPFIKWF